MAFQSAQQVGQPSLPFVWIRGFAREVVLLGKIGDRSVSKLHPHAIARRNCGSLSKCRSRVTRVRSCSIATAAIHKSLSGTGVPDNDLWIAAVAIEHDLTLVTRDRHFDKLPQLRRAMA